MSSPRPGQNMRHFTLIALLLLSACQSSPDITTEKTDTASQKTPEEGDTPDEEAPGDLAEAIVDTDAGLVVVNEAGDTVRTLSEEGAEWCVVDNRSGVLWMTREQSLLVLDLEAEGATPIKVAELPDVGFDHIEIAYPEITLGAAESHRFSIAAHLDLGDKVEMSGRVGCGGDMGWYCYEDDGWTVLIEELKEAETALNAVKVENVEALSTWLSRGEGKNMWSEPPSLDDVPEKLEGIPQDDCLEEPEACGTVELLEGTPYWMVTVANDRGDFYHEERQLYDPRSQRFIEPSSQLEPSETPFVEGEDGIFASSGVVSPTGRSYFELGEIVSFEDGGVFEGNTVCGWIGGGYPFDYQD